MTSSLRATQSDRSKIYNVLVFESSPIKLPQITDIADHHVHLFVSETEFESGRIARLTVNDSHLAVAWRVCSGGLRAFIPDTVESRLH